VLSTRVLQNDFAQKAPESVSMLRHAVLGSRSDGSPLSEEICAALDAAGVSGRRTRLSKGTMVSLQQGPQGGLHLLIEGRMKLQRFTEEGRVVILELLDAGDLFGEMSLVGEDDGESAYAEALEEVEIETFPQFAVDRVLRRHSTIALSIARLIGNRRNRLETRLLIYVFWKVHSRLAHLLLDLAERFGKPGTAGTDGTEIDISLSQQDLGNLIGASREIVSLTLSEFRRRGSISMVGRRMVVNEAYLHRELRTKGL
jgi:CRP/FNR family transcriptional regulator, cyclic AMP receptor protein